AGPWVLPASPLVAAPCVDFAVGQNSDGTLALVYIAAGNKLHQCRQTLPVAGNWGPTASLDNSIAQQVGIARNGDGRLEVFYVGTPAVAGTLRPLYEVLSMFYAPPGTNGGKSTSSVDYAKGSTIGTTTSISDSFKSSVQVTTTVGGILAGGS